MPSAIQQQRQEVEQLRREAALKRIPVSQAIEDIKVKRTVIAILKNLLLEASHTIRTFAVMFRCPLGVRESRRAI